MSKKSESKNIEKRFISILTTLLPVAVMPVAVFAATGDKAQIDITINVVTHTCSFDNTAPMISLDEVSAMKLSNSGSAIVGWKDVDVDIQCGSGIESVRIIPTGNTSSGDESAFANIGTAQNVGLRLMTYQGASILYPDGSRYVTVSPSGGKGNYRFRAGYVATASPIRAGSFMAVVNLSFDYS